MELPYWACLYGVWRTSWKGTFLARSPFCSRPTSCRLIPGGSLLTVLRICSSMRVQPGYNEFRSKLEECLPLLDEPTLPTTGNHAVDAALRVLKAEREKGVRG